MSNKCSDKKKLRKQGPPWNHVYYTINIIEDETYRVWSMQTSYWNTSA
jgi:hypothetical protein